MVYYARLKIDAHEIGNLELRTGRRHYGPLQRLYGQFFGVHVTCIVAVCIVVTHVSAHALFKHSSCRGIDIQPVVAPNAVAHGKRDSEIVKCLP